MIEREFVKEKAKYLKAKKFILAGIPKNAGIGRILIEKTPLGERVTIEAVKPGLIIGRKGKTISDMTLDLKEKFRMENPQIEVHEITNPALNAMVMANRIASDFEKFGSGRYKGIAHRILHEIMLAGAIGAEIRIAGRGVPSSRARAWRFPAGYMLKSGQLALEEVDIAQVPANLRTGTVGVQVRIMPPTIKLPDKVKVKEHAKEQKQEEIKQEQKPEETKAEATQITTIINKK